MTKATARILAHQPAQLLADAGRLRFREERTDELGRVVESRILGVDLDLG